MASTVAAQVGVDTRMSVDKGEEFEKFSGWCSFGVSIQISLCPFCSISLFSSLTI